MKNYYVEYTNGGEYNNVFCDKKTLNKLKRCSWINVLIVKKVNPKTDKWEIVNI